VHQTFQILLCLSDGVGSVNAFGLGGEPDGCHVSCVIHELHRIPCRTASFADDLHAYYGHDPISSHLRVAFDAAPAGTAAGATMSGLRGFFPAELTRDPAGFVSGMPVRLLTYGCVQQITALVEAHLLGPDFSVP
jgi:hypothetical protein